MSTSAFPLFQLPSLALKEIIEKIEGTKEQCKLSFCSKRMYYTVKYYIVKHSREKSTLSLKLCGSKDYTEIRVFNQKSPEDVVTFGVRDEGDLYCWETEKIPSYKRTERLFSHGKNVIEGTKFFVESLFDLFAAKVEKIEVNDNSIWLLDFVEERQGGYSYDAEVWNETEQTDEQLKHILLDLNPRSLEINQKPSDKFEIENFHKKYENLTIHAATWVTLENLYQLDCVKVDINETFLSNTEINRYFKHVLLDGGAPRLRVFSAAVRRSMENVIMDGIRYLLVERPRLTAEGRYWNVIARVRRDGGWVMVYIKFTLQTVHLEIKQI